MSALNEWPTPSGWLYGFIDTSVPGYRQMSMGSSTYDFQITDGYRSFPSLITQLNTQLTSDFGAVGTATTDTLGRVVIGASSGGETDWTDRLGWLLGFDVKPGDKAGTTGGPALTLTSDRPPPAAIPLMSVSWSTVNRAVETMIEVDRRQRGHGYLFGDADVMRFKMLLHVQALRSFREGWCLSGQVIVSTKSPADFSTDSPWSPSNTDGYIQGYVLGIDKGRWIDDTRTLWQTELLISKA
tara:strand:- start:5521 stop:6243 length:723 start_codon:yes stop_codon:yes gene_type:complete